MYKQKIIAVVILLLAGTGILLGQYHRGSYGKKLLLIPRQDSKDLPKTKKFRILRSIGKDTHIAVFDMNSIMFYIDRDNTTEDSIDGIYRFDPWDTKVLKRLENPFAPGKFSELKADIIKKGLKKDYASFSFPGLDYFISYCKKKKYSLTTRGSGFLVQIKDPDSSRNRAAMGLHKEKKKLTIKTNFSPGTRGGTGIIYPVHVLNTQDPTVLRLINEGSASLQSILKGRK